MRLFDSVDTYEPMLAGVSLFEISQIKVFVSDDCVSCAIISGRASEMCQKSSVRNIFTKAQLKFTHL